MVDVSSGGRIEPQRSETVVVVEDDGDAGTVTFAEAKYYVHENAGRIVLGLARTGGFRPLCFQDPKIAHSDLGRDFCSWSQSF